MNVRPTPTLRAALLVTALGLAMPAAAQIYKWVGADGAVTYSNVPPPSGTRPKTLDAVSERVTVYTPDAELVEAMKPDPARDAKIADLERDLQAARRQSAAKDAASAQKTDYERCVAERRVDCEALRTGIPPAPLLYAPAYPYVVGQARKPPRGTKPEPQTDPPAAVGVDKRPKVGIDNRPRVGVDNRPKVGLDERTASGTAPTERSIGLRPRP